MTFLESQARLLSAPILESGDPPKNITYQSLANLLYHLYEKYNKARIYFSEETCELIDKVINKSKVPISFYQLAMKVSQQVLSGQQGDLQNELQDKLMDIWEEVEESIPAARKAIEKDFRKILGVIN